MKIAILGAAGTVGRAAAHTFTERGHTVRVVGRSDAKLREAFPRGFEVVSADLTTADGCRRALTGMDAGLYTLGLPYTATAFAGYGPMMTHAVTAAREVGVGKLMLISNVYPYGRPQTPRVAEIHPRQPCSVKGTHRKVQEDILLGAHGSGGLSTLSLRLPDFYGPHAELSLTHQVFGAAVQGKTANVFGPIDTPHEFVFTPDVGPVLADLVVRDDAFGDAYNLAGASDISMRAFAEKVYAALGQKPRLRVAGPTMMRVLGLFSPLMREFVEMAYLQSEPVLLDDGKLRGVLGNIHKTSYDEGIRHTLDHLRAVA
jgi:nucleoside-diphosphate-sugar epimerase